VWRRFPRSSGVPWRIAEVDFLWEYLGWKEGRPTNNLPVPWTNQQALSPRSSTDVVGEACHWCTHHRHHLQRVATIRLFPWFLQTSSSDGSSEETVIEPRRPQLFPSHFEPIKSNWTRCREVVHPSRRSEQASPNQTVNLPTIPFHRVSSAGRTQRHLIRAIDDGHVAALALLDLSSAFDSHDHFASLYDPGSPSQSSH